MFDLNWIEKLGMCLVMISGHGWKEKLPMMRELPLLLLLLECKYVGCVQLLDHGMNGNVQRKDRKGSWTD